MSLKRALKCLLLLLFTDLPHTVSENVLKALEGETVRLPCHSPPEDSELLHVTWTRNRETICGGNVNQATVHIQCRPRFTLIRKSSALNIGFNNYSITINDVELSDSGNYSCKTTRIVPPPALDNVSNVILHVAARPRLSLRTLNGSNDTCVHLLCSLEGLNSELVTFTWRRGGQRSLDSFTSSNMSSELSLCEPDWSEGETFTCDATYTSEQPPLSESITLDFTGDLPLNLLIISCSAAAGLVFLIIIIIVVVVLCKCRKTDENGSMVFSNKIYENFSFAMTRQNIQSSAKPQQEECIYEN